MQYTCSRRDSEIMVAITVDYFVQQTFFYHILLANCSLHISFLNNNRLTIIHINTQPNSTDMVFHQIRELLLIIK